MKMHAKFIGRSCIAFEKDKIYQAIGYDPDQNLVAVVDESNENYLYSPELFEFGGDYHDLPIVSMFI
ncbi:hypothetical protein [Enterococcus xiangfangensis]|uniref:Uncharacterized protein n=1 Tax=Enterococcus xiangfangensis TaxID=1296537 RepID=A0ABU3FDJ7_9ENTE|nr:hypothetical protein [Enterococcus xiangfangensis]MDT2760752.1 hypothetical protein [Enterococcus xiangfangensis]